MNVAFVGNCNTQELLRAAKTAAQGDPEFQPTFFWRQEAMQEQALTQIAAADKIVYQAMDYEIADAVKDLMDAFPEKVIRAPYLAGNFLWPFASKAHPRNGEGMGPAFPAGPYEAMLSDAQLIALMQKMPEAPSEEIVDRYLELDFNKITPLDRFYEFNKVKYTRLGESCGLNMWPIIENCLVDHRLFWTWAHPSAMLLWPMARLVLEQLKLSGEGITQALRSFGEPLDFVHTPIHPSVVRHFGLRSISETERYRYFSEGRFTAREYFIRFVDFTFDEAIPEALRDLHERGKTEAALETLSALARERPDNADLCFQIGVAYETLGRRGDAAPFAVRAMQIEPQRPEFQAFFRKVVEGDALGRAAPAVLTCGQTLRFGANGAIAGLRSGWSRPQAWGVWASGEEARLNFALNGLAPGDRRGAVDLEFDLQLGRITGDDLILEVLADDRVVGRWRFGRHEASTRQVRAVEGCPVTRLNGDDLLNLRIRIAGSDLIAAPAASKEDGAFGLVALVSRSSERSRATGPLGLFSRRPAARERF